MMLSHIFFRTEEYPGLIIFLGRSHLLSLKTYAVNLTLQGPSRERMEMQHGDGTLGSTVGDNGESLLIA